MSHVTYLEILGPPNISGMAEDANLKFCTRIDGNLGTLNPQNKKKLVKRGRGLGHVMYFSNFGTLLISLERLKTQTSNIACGLKVRDTIYQTRNSSADEAANVNFLRRHRTRTNSPVCNRFAYGKNTCPQLPNETLTIID